MGLEVIEVMGVEALVDLREQFGGGVQVALGGGDIHMPQVGGQRRQPGVDIASLTIPGQQAGNGEGVTKILEAWTGVFAPGDAAVRQQLVEVMVDAAVMQPVATQIHKQGGLQPLWCEL